MQALRVVPKIVYFDTVQDFHAEFQMGKRDLVLTIAPFYKRFLAPLGIESHILFPEDYGTGEPSDEMIDAIAADLTALDFDRIIALGGGTVLDIAKILALDCSAPSLGLFEGTVPPVKKRVLVMVPTTCGTGSEVTNVSIAELKSKGTKKGLAVDQTYGDYAVLIPQALEGLPYSVFVTSSVDALIHALESFLSPKASPFTDLFGLNAMRLIMNGYRQVAEKGPDEWANHSKEFLLASTYAGIAFGNAGCAAVHALSYSIGGAFHVPHGEANYQFFTQVFQLYAKKKPDGKIAACTQILADILGCDADGDVYGELDRFLGKLIQKKPLREYGMTEDQIETFTDSTLANQQRLLGNNYVPLSRAELRDIFARLY